MDGSFYQVESDPNGAWDGPVGCPRYADFMEFGILLNRTFYQRMKNHVRSLGVRVPIVASNLLAGAADVYGHTDGDVMENNVYFNHPLFPIEEDNVYRVAALSEYVSVNPLTMQKGIGSIATTMLSMASTAIVKGKPFLISEWNEYGLHSFHSTAFVQTVAYACLNDWDGLILYNYQTSEKWNDQPDDEICSVFDAYNDPALILQWGFMASMFLREQVKPANAAVDLVYTQNDLLTLPHFHSMPMTFFPYVTSFRNVFLDGGETYQGEADVAVNAGFLNSCNLAEAKHGIYYAWSPYRDAKRCYLDENRLSRAATNGRKVTEGIYLGKQNLVIEDICKLSKEGDYRKLAACFDKALKEWNVIPEGTGYVDEKLISDTGEICYDPEHTAFWIRSPWLSYFSGAPKEQLSVTDKIKVAVKNDRISLAVVNKEGKKLDEAKEFLVTAISHTGMDQTECRQGAEMMGVAMQEVVLRGKLYLDTLEGSILVKAKRAYLKVFNPVGEVIGEYQGKETEEGICFEVDGSIPGGQYYLTME